MKMCPIALKNLQIGFNILPNNKETLKQLPKTFKMLPIWWNFPKSGHTVSHFTSKPNKNLSICQKSDTITNKQYQRYLIILLLRISDPRFRGKIMLQITELETEWPEKIAKCL